MPELPEVETTARGLRPRLVGQRVRDVRGVDWLPMLPNAEPAELRQALAGRAVAAVERRGKYLLLRLDGGVSLAIHRKMTGNLLLRDPGGPPGRHTHLVLGFDEGPELHFVDPRKFGRVYLFTAEEQLQGFLAERLGPEPLEGLDATSLAARLRARRGRIKSLLLDQSFLAGLGNLYADEVLWEAGIHPLRPADSLTRAEVARLAAAIRGVLERAIVRRGTTLSDYRDAEGEQGENQDFLNVYGLGPGPGRPARPCPRCGRPIERLTIGQRSSHYCPRCQPARRQTRVVRAAVRSGGAGQNRRQGPDPPT